MGEPLLCLLHWLLPVPLVHKQVNEDCVMPVPPPKMKADSQLTLPLDINNYPMAKYVQLHFKVRVMMLGLMM